MLIGAATTLVVLVAVFLAYNANSGLPFVPSYQLQRRGPERGEPRRRQRRADRRHAGRHGRRDRRRSSAGTARSSRGSTLKLETTIKPLPVDSTVIVRPRSALGLKYVQITRGHSRRGFEDGATIPVRQATPAPVELDEVLNTFDDRTRAGRAHEHRRVRHRVRRPRGRPQPRDRGASTRCSCNLVPVMRNLSDPRTQLSRTVQALGRTARIVAPVAETQAALLRNLDTTFAALATVATPLQQSIRGGPPALDAATRALPQTRAVPGQHGGPVRRPAARRARAADRRADARRRARDRHAGAQAVRAAQRAPRAHVPIDRAPRRRPARRPRRARPDEHRADPQPDARDPHAGPDGLQLHHAVVPQRGEPAQRGRLERHHAALHHPRRAAGPEQRGRPVLGAGERPEPGQLPPHEPVPEHRLARPAEGVRGGQRDVRGGPPGRSATCRATRARCHDSTTRSTTK